MRLTWCPITVDLLVQDSGASAMLNGRGKRRAGDSGRLGTGPSTPDPLTPGRLAIVHLVLALVNSTANELSVADAVSALGSCYCCGRSAISTRQKSS